MFDKIIGILKNKEIRLRIFFMIFVFLIIRICAIIKIPGIILSETINNELQKADVLSLINLLGGGGLQNFSIIALGVSPYITSQIVVQLLGKGILPAVGELSKKGEQGRKENEKAIRFLTLLIAAVQALGVIRMMENKQLISYQSNFAGYLNTIIIIVSGTMFMIWLGDQLTAKGLGNGISNIIFAGCVANLPTRLKLSMVKWLFIKRFYGVNNLVLEGVASFIMYMLFFLLIIIFVVFVELSKRHVPIQYTIKSINKESNVAFLPIKINSAGVMPVIFASSFMSTPSVIANLISPELGDSRWLSIFSYNEFTTIFNFRIPVGLIMYMFLVISFCFFYANLHFSPEQLSEDLQKNASYIPGIRPGKETANYITQVINRVTFLGAFFLAFIAGLPVVLTLLRVFGDNEISLSLGGTSLIIIVGVAIELHAQINGLLAADKATKEAPAEIRKLFR
ncbi:MAG: preprotein translocase subunit SecY [Bacilli bacterium]|nr:preprotein translocase subunit SecY [Bacilli bacterium]